jgi:hypothetical protein
MTLGVEIGVDMTPEGAHVIAMYVLPDSTMCVFYSQFHPQQTSTIVRTWVGLTKEEIETAEDGCWFWDDFDIYEFAQRIEAKLKEKNK